MRSGFFSLALLGALLVLVPPAGADAGEAEAAYRRKDYATAFRLYLPLARQGAAEAQTRVGRMYEGGMGAPGDLEQAADWYRKAAAQNYAEAQTCLGFLYENGRGVPKDDVQALRWYAKAAEQGDARARNNLGVLYLKGKGTPPDEERARHWFTLAARQGLPQARRNLQAMSGPRGKDPERETRLETPPAPGSGGAASLEPSSRLSPGMSSGLLPPGRAREVALFDVPLLYARRGEMRQAAATWSLPELPPPTGTEGTKGTTMTASAAIPPNPPSETEQAVFGVTVKPVSEAVSEPEAGAVPPDAATPAGTAIPAAAGSPAVLPAPASAGDSPEQGLSRCDRYDATRLLPGSRTLEICYGPDEFLQTLAYAFPLPQRHTQENLLKVVEVKTRLAMRHGEPDEVKGHRNSGPVRYVWNRDGVVISVERGWPDVSVFLRYTVLPEKRTTRRGKGEIF